MSGAQSGIPQVAMAILTLSACFGFSPANRGRAGCSTCLLPSPCQQMLLQDMAHAHPEGRRRVALCWWLDVTVLKKKKVVCFCSFFFLIFPPWGSWALVENSHLRCYKMCSGMWSDSAVRVDLGLTPS